MRGVGDFRFVSSEHTKRRLTVRLIHVTNHTEFGQPGAYSGDLFQVEHILVKSAFGKGAIQAGRVSAELVNQTEDFGVGGFWGVHLYTGEVFRVAYTPAPAGEAAARAAMLSM